MTVPAMFGSGLQPERTALAWRRTVISLLVGSVVAGRLLAGGLGWWAIVVGAGGLVVSGVVWVLAAKRGRRVARALSDDEPLPGGGLLLVLGVFVATAAAVGMGYVLV
jgi:uncharacterized membrane protein YidH (DUF202 family)